MKIHPYILGSGNAGKAMAKALAMIPILDSSVELAPSFFIPRGQSLAEIAAEADMKTIKQGDANPKLLLIANPHGLHAEAIIEGTRAGFRNILVEKPAAVSMEQISKLAHIDSEVSVFHVYRQMWGPQKIKKIIENGELGQIISIEGRYWQSSSASRALMDLSHQAESWKNDPALGGNFDALIDIAPHWVDTAIFLMGGSPSKALTWLSHVNAETPHRDTHVQVVMDYAQGARVFGSISKTVHGSTNFFEINVLGSKKSASWIFENPDQILISQGPSRKALYRDRAETDNGTMQPPFHSAGWLEGYTDIIHQTLLRMNGQESRPVPRLQEHLTVMKILFNSIR